MEDKKIDRRIAKTRMHMIQTTLELLRNNSFSKISVSDICEEAMISRSTFYTHFEDKFALLDACMEQIEQKLLHDTESADPRSRHNAMITTIEADARLFRNIFINGRTEELQTFFSITATKIFLQSLKCKQMPDIIFRTLRKPWPPFMQAVFPPC